MSDDPRDAPVAGRRYDAALHLLDRQVIDPDGRLVAKSTTWRSLSTMTAGSS